MCTKINWLSQGPEPSCKLYPSYKCCWRSNPGGESSPEAQDRQAGTSAGTKLKCLHCLQNKHNGTSVRWFQIIMRLLPGKHYSLCVLEMSAMLTFYRHTIHNPDQHLNLVGVVYKYPRVSLIFYWIHECWPLLKWGARSILLNRFSWKSDECSCHSWPLCLCSDSQSVVSYLKCMCNFCFIS